MAGTRRSEIRGQKAEQNSTSTATQSGTTKAAAKDVFVNPPVAAPPVGSVTATMTGTITTDADSDAKADPSPADAITYTTTITNNTGADVSGLQFTDTVDPHTTIISGSAVAAGDDAYTTIGNVNIVANAAQGVLANDFNPNTGNNTGMTATAETKSSTSCTGGCSNNVTISADGSFTYDPPVDFTGTDTFTYTAHSGTTTTTATVRITVSGQIWFVNNNAGACTSNCDGRLSHPFTTLAAFNTANDGAAGHPGNGDFIFVYESATDYVGPVTLRNNQTLMGQDASASIETITTFSTPSGSTVLPAMNSANGTITNITSTAAAANAINLGHDNTLRGFTAGNVGAGGSAIAGTDFVTLTVGGSAPGDVSVNSNGRALNFVKSVGTATVNGNFKSVSSSGGANGVLFTGCAGTVAIAAGLLTGATSNEFQIDGTTPTINVTYSGSITYAGSSSAIVITASPDTYNGNITFDTGTLTVTGGTAINLLAANGTHNYYTTSGSASISGAATGVSLGTNTNGTYTFGQSGNPASFAITNTTGTSFVISNTAAKVTYNGNISQANNQTMLSFVSHNSSGNATFQNGTLTATNGAGVVMSDADAAVSFNGTMNLSNSAGVLIDKGSGGTIGFGANTSITSTGTAFSVRGDAGGSHNPAVNGAITYSGTINKTSTGLLLDVNTLSGSLTFNGTTLTGSTSNAAGVTASLSNVTGTVTTNHLSLTSSSGSFAGTLVAISGTNTAGNFNFHHMTLSAVGVGNTGKGLTASGGGTLTVTATGGSSSIDVGSTALDVNSLALGASTIATVNSDGGTNGVLFTSCTGGTFAMTSGAITGQSGSAFKVVNGSASVSYGGTITQNAASQKAVDISGITGGTIGLSGAIGSNGGAGVSIEGTGGTVNISGDMTLNNTGAVFKACSGTCTTPSGTGLHISVTGTNNTVGATNAATGQGVLINRAQIDAGGVTFKKVSTTGGTNGIKLDTTGTAGGFTIAGDGGGANNGSGGTIQTSTAEGILTNSTGAISLGYLNVNNSGTDSISVTGSTGVTINRTNVTDNAGVSGDEGFNLINNTGTITLTNDVVDSAPHHQSFIDNNNTNLTAINVSNSTFKCTVGNTCQPVGSVGADGFLVQIRGTSVLTSANVQTSSFIGNRATGIQVTAADTASIGSSSGGTITAPAASHSFVLQTSTIQNNNAGIDFSKAQNSNMTFQVLNNTTITGHRSNAINTFSAAGGSPTTGGTLTGNIDGNVIGTQGTKDSGSAIGIGIRAIVQGDTTQGFITINNNTIREVPNAHNVELFSQNGNAASGTGAARFKVTNNTFPLPSGTNQSIGCGAGVPCMADGVIFSLADEHNTACLLITGNNVFDANTFSGVFDVYLATRTGPPAGAATTVQTGVNGGNSAAALAFINANNTLNGTLKSFDEAGNITTVSSCGTFPPLLLGEGGVMSALTAPSLVSSLLVPAAGSARCSDDNFGLFSGNSKAIGTSLTQRQLDQMVSAAIDRWSAAGLTAAQAAQLRGMRFEVGELANDYLGEAEGNRILVDREAQGKGWFIDATPQDDAEFATKTSTTRRYTDPMNAARSEERRVGKECRSRWSPYH